MQIGGRGRVKQTQEVTGGQSKSQCWRNVTQESQILVNRRAQNTGK